jgi:hypothetical protein
MPAMSARIASTWPDLCRCVVFSLKKEGSHVATIRVVTIRIYLIGQEDFSLATNFVVDDFSLIVQ